MAPTQPAPATATAPADPGGDAVRVVLFGMPDAGKSSLLGALAQSAQSQERQLHGRLVDLSNGGLAELQRRLYDERPRETLEEIVPYPVAYEPFDGPRPDPSRRRPAVLIDCDGRIANELLTRRKELEGDKQGALGRAVLGADALLLVVDAAANPEQIDADFGEFVRFLRFLERSRGRRSDVGGLPVWLVLSKCDLLARPGDTDAAWHERIEQREAQVASRFKEFLDAEAGGGPVPFGSIDLHVVATAVKRPALATAPAAPREPV